MIDYNQYIIKYPNLALFQEPTYVRRSVKGKKHLVRKGRIAQENSMLESLAVPVGGFALGSGILALIASRNPKNIAKIVKNAGSTVKEAAKTSVKDGAKNVISTTKKTVKEAGENVVSTTKKATSESLEKATKDFNKIQQEEAKKIREFIKKEVDEIAKKAKERSKNVGDVLKKTVKKKGKKTKKKRGGSKKQSSDNKANKKPSMGKRVGTNILDILTEPSRRKVRATKKQIQKNPFYKILFDSTRPFKSNPDDIFFT